ncbi:MAG: S9 family peptidase [Candidatus Wallbacteria bacterium]|nr:S9 family peptidase [Candidatus Wallbacteria bacterium]
MNRLRMNLLLLLILFCRIISLSAEAPVPPKAEKVRKIMVNHGDIRIDNYYWLNKKENPKVINYLNAENTYTETMMKDTEQFQKKLYTEMVARIKEDDNSVPQREGDFYYYYRTEKDKQYIIHCRKKGSLEASEEIILDENELAKGHDFCDVSGIKQSPDHKLLAFSINFAGDEKYTIQIKDLSTGQMLPDKIENSEAGLEWAADNATIFYTVKDQSLRPYRLYRHKLGTDAAKDELVFEEPDQAYFVGIAKTRSKSYLLLYIGSNTTTEFRYLRSDDPAGKFKMFQPRKQGVEYYVDQQGDRFLIRTNYKAENFRLMQTSLKATELKYWKDLIPCRKDTLLENIDAFENHLVVYERGHGLQTIKVLDLKKHQEHYVKFPEPVYSYTTSENPEYKTKTLRFNYTSMITPMSVFDYDMDTRGMELKKQTQVNGLKPFLYQTERVFAKAKDGTRIPISLVYRKGIVKDGKNPLLLYGYGSYGISMDPYFSSARLSLLNRGFIYAIAHIRGGQENGRAWYENGKMDHKLNTFNDFIACAEHLINTGYTRKNLLAIQGGSAGGLLMGAVITMRPDLFQAGEVDVPFVDVINTMLDPNIPLTVTEYEEWGNPNKSKDYMYMKSYSPYDNIQAVDYPIMLVTGGLNDPRVGYWEPAKFVCKLRELKTDSNLLILKTNMGAGHMGASGRYDYLKDVAFEYAFFFKALGLRQ